jgi:hypothetical protein
MCANYSQLKRVLEAEPICPMCEASVPPMSVKLSDDSTADFKALVALMKEQVAEDEEKDEEVDSDEEASRLI